MYVLGIDPGPLPGVVWFGLPRDGQGIRLTDAQAMQVTAPALIDVLEAYHLMSTAFAAVAYERFVVGPRAARSTTASAGATTRNLVGEIEAWANGRRLIVHARSASEVKPWATDARLDAAGLLDLTKGMRHARDAARHALFCAVRNFGLADPLSRKAGA